jgi:uncharacterized protein DUF4826
MTRGDAAFLVEARAEVLAYLERHGVKHGGVPEEPAWYLAPYVSLWPVRSGRFPASTGWFAIAGDLPTDYVSTLDAPDPRSALRRFSRLWLEVAGCMQRGVEHPECKIGSPESWPDLQDLLRRRANLLGSWASDDRVWGKIGR